LTKRLALALIGNESQALKSLEVEIREFLKDEAVLQRTEDCNIYFRDYVPVTPKPSKVNRKLLIMQQPV